MHPESLLRVPLVRAMLEDPHVRLVPRAIDRAWFYEGVLPAVAAGFAPATGAIYYGARSALADWLQDPGGSAREHNAGDFLVHELLFAVHDYLHCWAYQVIAALWPELGFGTAPVTAANLEDMAFCHLLTEAAAVVGLDYWYLATVTLDDVVPIGTAIEGLTVDYHERHAAEYRRFCPGLVVQEPDFFVALARFYATGRFPGFSAGDLRRSARTFAWLKHELTYGEKQRLYTRSWLAWLATEPLEPAAGPLDDTSERRTETMQALGELLWAKVKDGVDRVERRRLARPAESPAQRAPDFRFVNLNALADDVHGEGAHYIQQLVSRCDFDAFPDARLPALHDAVRLKQASAVVELVRDQPRVPVGSVREPRDLFLPG